MKKFLSILLALAVGFTFTFGSAMSAFAGVADHAVAAKSAVTATAKALDATNVLADHDNGGLTIHKAAWVKAYQNDYPTELNNIINARYAEINTKPGDANTTEADVIAMFYEAKTSGTHGFTSDPVPANVADVVNAVYSKVADEAAGYEFESVKEDALAILAKVDLSEFSKTTPTSKDGSKVYTYFERADKVVKDVIAQVTAAGFDGADPTVATAKTLIGYIGEVAESKYTNVTDALPTETAGSGFLEKISEKFNPNGTTTGIYVLSTAGRTDTTGAIKNTTEEAAEAASLDAKKDSLKSFVASKGSSYVTTVSTGAGVTTAAIEAAKTAKENYVKAYNYIIDAAKTEAALKTNLGASSASMAHLEAAIKELDTAMAGPLAANEALVAELNTYAAKCLAETDVTGAKVRDEKLVAESVQKSTVAAYKDSIAKNNWTGLSAAKADVEKNCYVTVTDIEYARQVALTTVENARKASLKNYYEKEQTEVNAAYDKLVAEIKAANTSSDLVTAGTTATLTGIKTAGQVFTSVNNFVSINKYRNYQVILNTGVKLDYQRDFANAKIELTTNGNLCAMNDAGYWIEFFAAKGARTQAEVDAMWNDAVAAMEAVPTAKAVASAKEKAETAINNLPATLKITVADATAIKAAFDAAQEYAAITGKADYTASDVVNKGQLTTAITTLATLEKNDIAIAASKLPATVTIADKAAVKAVAESQEAFNEKVDTESTDMYKIAGVTAIAPTVSAKMADIRALELKAVKAAIDAIPFNITLDSKATIEAARAACNAFVEEYTTYEATPMYGDGSAYNAAAQITNIGDLENAEKELGQLEKDSKWTADDAKAYVQDLAVTVRTAKVGKKVKVTVNADVQKLVDNGFTVKYKFYKSTKKSSGYKNTVNKTTNTYTNTNPVKGKNYYKVKLVVKNADGTVVATTPLTQCKYGVRTIK